MSFGAAFMMGAGFALGCVFVIALGAAITGFMLWRNGRDEGP